MYDLISLGQVAKKASTKLRVSSTATRNDALYAIAQQLRRETPAILDANKIDVATAKSSGIKSVMLDRLTLDAARIEDIAVSIEQVIALPDPVGHIDEGFTRPNGIQILKTRVPMGVIAMIYEARPNVTVDAAVICLKSANACILRGGKEAFATNRILAKIMREAIKTVGLPESSICLVEDTSHDTATRLMQLNGYVDLLIPRGSAQLIQTVVKNATVPVIETGAGNCHLYVDKFANLEMAVNIIENGKTQRPSVCNSLETVLVHMSIADRFLPMMKEALDRHKTELRCCPAAKSILKTTTSATPADWETEYNDYILAVKVVEDMNEAIRHIEKYSTKHSEAIVTDNLENSRLFTAMVDSATVYVNASTRFTDGGEFGFGTEIGISTQKLHARGPMGLKELTSIKYIINGNGQIRQ